MPQFRCTMDGDLNYLETINGYSDGIFGEFVDSRPNGVEFLGVGDTVHVAPQELVPSSNSVDIERSLSFNSACTKAENKASTNGRRNKKKRKSELGVADGCKDKDPDEEAAHGESSVAVKCNMETSSDNSKISETQKTDYIHVRARRGQATDSHSLAERARRERINKKMKCLQDLVPGCNKVTGKLGMLDEIINYVQSLQTQVEFLSTKLASLYPGLDFNLDSFIKEFPAHVTSFPALAAALPSEMDNLAYLHFIQEQGATNFGIDLPINPTQSASKRTQNSSMAIPTVYLDSSSVPTQQLSSWDTELRTLNNKKFH